MKASVAGETHEYADMYPGMAGAAGDESFDDIADRLGTLAKAEPSNPTASRTRRITSTPKLVDSRRFDGQPRYPSSGATVQGGSFS
jgi:hypothetical protein